VVREPTNRADGGHNGGVDAADAPSKPPTGRIQYPRWLWWVGALVAVIVTSAIVALAFLGTGDSPNQAGGAVDQLIPAANSQIVQQAAIGIDLAPGHDAELTVNGVPLPVDQVVAEKGLNTFTFRPGPGKAFEEWPAGESCVTAAYWPSETPSAVNTRTWCFTVV
jgi:hypothetical protein